MFVRLRMLRYAVVAVLVAASLVSIVWAASAEATGGLESCPSSPDAKGVRLVVGPESVAAGQTVHFRIDNSTGPTVTYGSPYGVQECLGGVWVLSSFSPPGPWPKQLIRQRPSHGRWQSVEVPMTAVAGQYRIRKSVQFGERGHSLYGDFDVVAPGV
jgi:hypothetical protein